jgi:hypothetical protein
MIMRTLLAALAAVACSRGSQKPPAPQRDRGLVAQLQVIATQPVIISTMAAAFPLTEAGRAQVTEKLQALQMRFDEAKNLVESGDPQAADAVKRLDAARKEAWDALDKAPRVDRSS